MGHERDLADHLEQTIFFARAGMELLQPGNNNLTTAASYIGGGGGGGGVPASSPENIIQMAAQLKTDRARPGHLENIKRRGNSDALLQRLGIQRAAWV